MKRHQFSFLRGGLYSTPAAQHISGFTVRDECDRLEPPSLLNGQRQRIKTSDYAAGSGSGGHGEADTRTIIFRPGWWRNYHQ